MGTHKHNDIPPELERYLALCKRVYERMEASGEWPWADDWKKAPGSPDWPEMLKSMPNPNDV